VAQFNTRGNRTDATLRLAPLETKVVAFARNRAVGEIVGGLNVVGEDRTHPQAAQRSHGSE
jgi:hypothetical protein